MFAQSFILGPFEPNLGSGVLFCERTSEEGSARALGARGGGSFSLSSFRQLSLKKSADHRFGTVRGFPYQLTSFLPE